MKPLSYEEIRHYLDWIRPQVVGAQLQDVISGEDFLLLKLYLRGERNLFFDLRPASPFMVLLDGAPSWPFKKKPKPAALFLSSHGKNLFLQEAETVPDKGRVVRWVFANRHKACELELSLIPRSANLMVISEGKKVSWAKPKNLPPPGPVPPLEKEPDWNHFAESYRVWRRGASAGVAPAPSAQSGRSLEKILEKKRTAYQRLTESLLKDEAKSWRALGEALKLSSEPPAELASLYDSKMSLKENRERAFRKAKDLERKRQGSQERAAVLQKEIKELEARLAAGETIDEAAEVPSRGSGVLKATESRGRTMHLSSGAQAIVGRSAKDNLALLRQAKPWDLWIHLKDEPSAHGIIFRNKNQKISDAEVDEVARWIFRRHSRGRNLSAGIKFDVVIVECRHVRPIKGDRLGRVSYHSPSVRTVKFTDASRTFPGA